MGTMEGGVMKQVNFQKISRIVVQIRLCPLSSQYSRIRQILEIGNSSKVMARSWLYSSSHPRGTFNYVHTSLWYYAASPERNKVSLV